MSVRGFAKNLVASLAVGREVGEKTEGLITTPKRRVESYSAARSDVSLAKNGARLLVLTLTTFFVRTVEELEVHPVNPPPFPTEPTSPWAHSPHNDPSTA